MFRRISTFVLLLLSLVAPVLAADAPAATKAKRQPIPIQDVRLPNGLRVLLSEDHTAPVYALTIAYNVGSRDEVKGHTGFAHLFEHLMFEGSANVGKGEHSLLIQENGGYLNAATNKEWTLYFESLPANQLDLGLFLEADRMRALGVTQERLDNQRNAVQEERRLRVDNQPYGRASERLPELLFDSFSYQHSVVGSMADLNAASLEDVQRFFKTYYAPNNAILVLVGDFNSQTAIAQVKKYFASIPSQPAPPPVQIDEQPRHGERRETIESPFATVPHMDIAYRIPSGNTADYYALDVLFGVLTSGESSRFYQRLVKEQQVAAGIGGAADEDRGPGFAKFSLTPAPGKPLADAEKAIYAQLEALDKDPPTDEEIQRIRTLVRAKAIGEFRGSMDRAQQMAIYALFYNEPGLINTLEQHYDAVTREDLLRVAKRYLTAENRVVVTTVPAPKPAADAPAKQGGQ
jgi:zinc protease